MTDRPSAPDDEQDVIAGILRRAGKRPPIDAERTRRVRDAVRARWSEGVVRRRRRRRVVAASLALAAATVLCALIASYARRSPMAARPEQSTSSRVPAEHTIEFVVEAVVGTNLVRAGSGDGAPGITITRGQRIRSAARFETDTRGSVALRTSTGHWLRIGASTVLRCLSPRTIEIERGTVYVDSGPGENPIEPLDVRAPLGTVREIGTRYEVYAAPGTLRVRLRDGRVGIEPVAVGRRPPAAEIAVEPETELTLLLDGTLARRALRRDAPEWTWLLRVTPVPDVDGRPVRVLLEWVARERGWSLRFADARAEAAADRTLLHGEFDRLEITDVLDVALPASRLEYRVEGGVLSVSRP